MDALSLLHEAREAGLVLRAHDGVLNVSGPRDAAPIVERLKAYKADILAALVAETMEPEIESACMVCGRPADDADSNVVHDNPDDTHYRRVHVAPECYDRWFQNLFGKKATPANLNGKSG